MTVKELKKLAAACRSAGIKTYKSGDVEFTLTDEAPLTPYKAAKAALKASDKASQQAEDVESDGLSGDDLLFWSVGETEDLIAPKDKA
jgi:hypothetical protein